MGQQNTSVLEYRFKFTVPIARILVRALQRNRTNRRNTHIDTHKHTRSRRRSCDYCSVAKSHPTLCDSMNCSTPGSPVLHYLLGLAQTHVHWVSDAIHPTISSSVVPFSCLQSFPASESFPMSWLFASGGQSIGASASASVLPMNIQDWFPLGLTALISLLSKGLSSVFSNTTARKHQFSGVQPSLWSSSHIRTWLLEKP